MSYKQAMKHSRNHRKQRYYQPIVLGSFIEKECEHVFHPVYRNLADKTVLYQMCSQCKKIIPAEENSNE